MFNQYTPKVRKIIEYHRQDLLREAAQDRLLYGGRLASPRLYCRVLAHVGSLLIAAGQKLQEPYALAAPGKVKAG